MRFVPTASRICLVGAMIMPMQAETKVGGMTAAQAFPDPITAEWVRAVDRERFDKADKLLAQGAKANMIGTDGITPLLWIIGAYGTDARRIEHMLKSGADPNLLSPGNNLSGMYFAVACEDPRILTLMLKYKGNPNLMGKRGGPVLFDAMFHERFEQAYMLIKAGADVNCLDRRGDSAAAKALIYGRFDVVAYFLEHGLSAGLDQLAIECEERYLPPNDDMQPWKTKVIEILKARGASFVRKPLPADPGRPADPK